MSLIFYPWLKMFHQEPYTIVFKSYCIDILPSFNEPKTYIRELGINILTFFFFFNNFIIHNCTIKTTSEFDGKLKCECEEFRPVSSFLLLN
jgi:hypothetical protein